MSRNWVLLSPSERFFKIDPYTCVALLQSETDGKFIVRMRSSHPSYSPSSSDWECEDLAHAEETFNDIIERFALGLLGDLP